MSNARLIPEAIAAERAVAGIILIGLGGKPPVDPDDCLDPLAADVVRHGLHLPRPCPITVAHSIGDNSDRLLMELRNLMVADYVASNWPAYVALIAAAAHRRRVIEVAAHVTDAAYDGADMCQPLARLIDEVSGHHTKPHQKES